MPYHIDREETPISQGISTCVHAAFTAHTAFTPFGVRRRYLVLEHFWSECFRIVSHLPSKSHISEVVQAGSTTPLVRLLSSRRSMGKYDTGQKNLSHKILIFKTS